jgi:prolyl oligopeptidase
MVQSSYAISKEATGESNHHGCSVKKIIEDTIVDVKFSGLSWRNEGFLLSMKTKRKRTSAKQMNTNYISTNSERQKKIRALWRRPKRRYIGGYVRDDAF